MVRQRCVRFAGGEKWVAELRGGAYFRWLRRTMAAGRLFGNHGRVHIGNRLSGGWGRVGVCRDELLFIVMPGLQQVADHLWWRRRQGMPIVVDVTADVFDDLAIGGGPSPAMARAWQDGTRPEAAVFWSTAAARNAFVDALNAADVVTTSWAELVEPLEDRTQQANVVHLPDLHRGRRNRAEFSARFEAVAALATAATDRR